MAFLKLQRERGSSTKSSESKFHEIWVEGYTRFGTKRGTHGTQQTSNILAPRRDWRAGQKR